MIKREYVKEYRELYEYINYRLKDIRVDAKGLTPLEKFRRTMKAKLTFTYRTVSDELNRVIDVLSSIRTSHVFYNKLFEATTGFTVDYCIDVLKRTRSVLKRVYSDSLLRLNNVTGSRDVVEVFKESVGKVLSVYRRKSSLIKKIKESLVEIYKVPDFTGDLVVVLSGMPQVGKSTLLGALTRSRPKTSPYPFTTKHIYVGHIDAEPYGRVVLIDAPGLLDRPIGDKNVIEVKAILAIRHLADAVLYLFDVNPSSYYSLEEQINVYQSIVKELGVREVVAAINKVDATPKEVLEKTIDNLVEIGVKPVLISALTGYNLEALKEKLVELLVSKKNLNR